MEYKSDAVHIAVLEGIQDIMNALNHILRPCTYITPELLIEPGLQHDGVVINRSERHSIWGLPVLFLDSGNNKITSD